MSGCWLSLLKLIRRGVYSRRKRAVSTGCALSEQAANRMIMTEMYLFIFK